MSYREYATYSSKVPSAQQKRDASRSPLKLRDALDEPLRDVVERSGVLHVQGPRDYRFALDGSRPSGSDLKKSELSTTLKYSPILVDDYMEKIVSPTNANK